MKEQGNLDPKMVRLPWFQLGLQNIRERGEQREPEWFPCVGLDLEENTRC